MKVCLGMPFRNETEMLKRNLPKIPDVFDEYIFLDTGSTDYSRKVIGTCMPKKKTKIIVDDAPNLDFGRWRNMIIERAEIDQMDWMFMLDADEAMFTKDYEILFKYLLNGISQAYRLTRINFIGDSAHYLVGAYPDWQGRVFKLRQGIYYAPKIHAEFHISNTLIRGTFLPQITIYHYGWTKNPEDKLLHYYNAERTLNGLPRVHKVPTDWKMQNQGIDMNEIEKFYGEQP